MTEENHRGSNIQPEMLVGVSAVLIGICALGVSLYEAGLMRDEQRAAVMPVLELSRSYSLASDASSAETTRLLLQAENVGIGPARIVDFQVTVDGEPRPTWGAAIRSLLGQESPVFYNQSSINGRTVPPGRMVTMMDLEDVELTGKILAEFDRLDFEACFCSIFDDCWTTRYSTFGVTDEVESCRQTEASFRE